MPSRHLAAIHEQVVIVDTPVTTVTLFWRGKEYDLQVFAFILQSCNGVGLRRCFHNCFPLLLCDASSHFPTIVLLHNPSQAALNHGPSHDRLAKEHCGLANLSICEQRLLSMIQRLRSLSVGPIPIRQAARSLTQASSLATPHQTTMHPGIEKLARCAGRLPQHHPRAAGRQLHQVGWQGTADPIEWPETAACLAEPNPHAQTQPHQQRG